MVVILPLGRTYDFSKCRFLLQHCGAKESNSGNECGRGSEESMLKNSIRWVGLFSSDHWVNVLFLFSLFRVFFPWKFSTFAVWLCSVCQIEHIAQFWIIFTNEVHILLSCPAVSLTRPLTSPPVQHSTKLLSFIMTYSNMNLERDYDDTGFTQCVHSRAFSLTAATV